MGEVIHFKMYSGFAQRKKKLFMPLSSTFVTILDATGKNQNPFIGIDVCTGTVSYTNYRHLYCLNIADPLI